MGRALILATTLLLESLAASAADPAAPVANGSLKWGGPGHLPEVLGTDLKGRTWRADALRGRPVLLHFWATWCAPCIGELPELDALRVAHPELVVLGVSLDDGDRRSLVSWLNRRGPEHPTIHEPRGLGAGLSRRFGVPQMPWAVLFDARGRVLAQGPPSGLMAERGAPRLTALAPRPVVPTEDRRGR